MADLKFIVSEVNKLIKTDYNMISFDALPIANLVQILVDVLADFGALQKVKFFNYIDKRTTEIDLICGLKAIAVIHIHGGDGMVSVGNVGGSAEMLLKEIATTEQLEL